MSIGVIIALIVFAGSTITAFVVASLQRKQMRQIELHRRDPSVPLNPPLSPGAVAFLKNLPYLTYSGALVYAAVMLLRDLGKSTPITRLDIAAISFTIAWMVATVGMMLNTFLLYRLVDFIFDPNRLSSKND
jgi:hypothetical protein